MNKIGCHIKRVNSKVQGVLYFLFFTIICLNTNAQEAEIRASIDSTSILIGQQINYKVEVLANANEPVVFPEGQTFNPLEVIESYAVDTSRSESSKIKLIKKYGLTQFDSGNYVIPKQKITIGSRIIETDTFLVAVNNVVLDTVNQGLYDIKPVIKLPEDYSKWWEILLYIIPVLLAIVLFLWWLLKRHKKKKEAEEYIPPFERAIATLHALDSKEYLAAKKYKEYYSELTDTIRRYYNEKVYDRSLESTTDELLERLELERDSGHIAFNKETLARLTDIFKRADLVKFARVNPPEGKAQADRLVVEEIVKETKEALPAPTQEELLKQEDYREALSRKRNRNLWLSAIGGVLGILLLATAIAIGVKGKEDVRDFVFGNMTRELAEGTWITSEYGAPPIIISTPKVLVRKNKALPPGVAGQMEATVFEWDAPQSQVAIALYQFEFPADAQVELEELITQQLQEYEGKGFTANIVKNEKYTTPNGGEGIRTFGTGSFAINDDNIISGEYTLLTFKAENNIQQVFISWIENDTYSQTIADRVLQSVEVEAPKQNEEEN